MAVCLPSAASHLSTAALRLLWFVSELLLERLSSPPHRRNIKPFCVPKYFRLPVTQSRKSEKGPINLADHYLSLLLAAGVMKNNP